MHITTNENNVDTNYFAVNWILDEEFYSVNQGNQQRLIKAIKPSISGTSKVVLTIEGKSYEFNYLIKRPKITITNAPVRDLAINEIYQLHYDVEGYIESIEWEVSNENIVKIGKNGEIIVLRSGTTNIKCILNNNINVFDEITITAKARKSYMLYTNIALKPLPYMEQKTDYTVTLESVAEKCYDGCEENIETIKYNNEDEFVLAWNQIALNEDNIIDYIIILSHGKYDALFQYNSDDDAELIISLSEINTRLLPVSAKGIILLSCNVGDIDVENNVATILAKKINNAPVIAPDGAVEVASTQGGLAINCIYEDQFYEYSKGEIATVGRTEVDGWIVYQDYGVVIGRRKTKTKNSNLRELTAFADKYYCVIVGESS